MFCCLFFFSFGNFPPNSETNRLGTNRLIPPLGVKISLFPSWSSWCGCGVGFAWRANFDEIWLPKSPEPSLFLVPVGVVLVLFFVEIRGVLAQNRWKCHFDHFCPFWNFLRAKIPLKNSRAVPQKILPYGMFRSPLVGGGGVPWTPLASDFLGPLRLHLPLPGGGGVTRGKSMTNLAPILPGWGEGGSRDKLSGPSGAPNSPRRGRGGSKDTL